MRSIDFSKWELRKLAIKMKGATEFKHADCVGSMEEEFELKTVTKSCRGVVKKSKTKPIGGTVTLSLHIPYDIYCAMFDMVREDLKEGVQGYGTNNVHQEFCAVAEMYNEENELMLVAYPNCVNASGPKTSIENGAEEIAEVELEITIMPDEHDYLRYECLPEDLPEGNESIASTWMTAFTPELVSAAKTV